MDLNQRQSEFYDTKKKNLPTRVWSYFRNGALNQIRKDLGIEKEIYELHKRWFGDLSKKKVLDLGCYEGNSLSIYLAQNAESYLGIDLSEKGIKNLSPRLKNCPNANAKVMDFLSDEFKERDYDLVYAYGVLHHFQNVDKLILKLNEKLKIGGTIVSYDPLQTSLPIKFLRLIYRPFQSDKDWEWPFSRETFYKFEKNFEILEKRAVLGKSKYAIFFKFLPLSKEKRLKKARQLHREDWEKSSNKDDYMFRCMQLSLLMKKN